MILAIDLIVGTTLIIAVLAAAVGVVLIAGSLLVSAIVELAKWIGGRGDNE